MTRVEGLKGSVVSEQYLDDLTSLKADSQEETKSFPRARLAVFLLKSSVLDMSDLKSHDRLNP